MLVTGSRRGAEPGERGQSGPSGGMVAFSPGHWEQLIKSWFLSRRIRTLRKTSVQPGAVGDSPTRKKGNGFLSENLDLLKPRGFHESLPTVLRLPFGNISRGWVWWIWAQKMRLH